MTVAGRYHSERWCLVTGAGAVCPTWIVLSVGSHLAPGEVYPFFEGASHVHLGCY